MPLYEYQCQSCGHRFEKIQSFSAPDEKACPKCGGAVERLISAPAIQFKGEGWYVNDYAGRNKAPASSGSGESASSGEVKGSAAAADSKPAASSDSTASAKPASSSSGSKSST